MYLLSFAVDNNVGMTYSKLQYMTISDEFVRWMMIALHKSQSLSTLTHIQYTHTNNIRKVFASRIIMSRMRDKRSPIFFSLQSLSSVAIQWHQWQWIHYGYAIQWTRRHNKTIHFISLSVHNNRATVRRSVVVASSWMADNTSDPRVICTSGNRRRVASLSSQCPTS